MDANQLIFFDIEMLCDKNTIPFSKMESIRLAAVKYHKKSEEKEFFDAFIKPSKGAKLSPFCKELTGIKQEEVDSAESFPTVFSEFLEWIGPIEESHFYSWGTNDIERLKHDIELHNLSENYFSVINQRYSDFQKTFTKFISGQDLSVENSLRLYDLPFEGDKHNPLYDALNTLQIYLQFKDNKDFNPILQLNEMVFKHQESVIQNNFKIVFEQMKEKKNESVKVEAFGFKEQINQLFIESFQHDLTKLEKFSLNHANVKHLQKVSYKFKDLYKRYKNVSENNSLIVDSNLSSTLEMISSFSVELNDLYTKGDYFELLGTNFNQLFSKKLDEVKTAIANLNFKEMSEKTS